MLYAIYLRKSRADLEAEAMGQGETLARHRAALLDYAAHHGLEIGAVYEAIISGVPGPCTSRLPERRI